MLLYLCHDPYLQTRSPYREHLFPRRWSYTSDLPGLLQRDTHLRGWPGILGEKKLSSLCSLKHLKGFVKDTKFKTTLGEV